MSEKLFKGLEMQNVEGSLYGRTWEDIVVDHEKRLKDLEAKLTVAVDDAEKWKLAFSAQSRKLQAVLDIPGVRETLAQIKGNE